MSATKHTPGPWAWHLVKVQRCIYAESTNGGVVAYVHGANVPIVESEANARMIAAAPELLDALQDLVALLPDPDLDSDAVQRQYVKKARAAIAKATGGAL